MATNIKLYVGYHLFVRSVDVEVGKIPKTGQNLKVCLVRSTV